MSKKKKKQPETTIENYYDLRVDKVDELVAILKGEDTAKEEDIDFSMNANMGVYDPKNVKRNGKEKEFNPYRTDFLSRIPTWIKAIVIKFWFSGAVCYFVMMGIMPRTGYLDQAVLTGLAMGVVVDVLVNPLFRFLETDRREYNAYMMFPFPFKAYWTFFANICYYILVAYLIAVSYTYLVMAKVIAGVEPLLFGLIAVAIDMVFIGIKDGIVALVRHLKNRKKESVVNV